MKLNDKGFSLIQVLISSGMLGAAAVIGIKMMNNQQKVAESTNQQYEISYIHEEIWRTLQNPLACESTFYGKSISDWNDTGLTSISSPFTESGKKLTLNLYKTYDSGFEFYGTKNLKIDHYELERSDASLERILNLKIAFDRGPNIVGERIVFREIPIIYSLESGAISTCNALEIKSYADDEIIASKSDRPIMLSQNTSIGKDIRPTEGLVVHGDLSIISTSKLECTPQNEGMISFNKETSSYVLCTGTPPWKKLGKNKINWEMAIPKTITPSTERVQELGEFRLCSLSKVSKTRAKNCSLLNQTSDLNVRTIWSVAKSKTNDGSCTYTCFE